MLVGVTAEHDEAIAPLTKPVSQAVHVDDVPPVEYVLTLQAVHALFAKEYPALHDVTTTVHTSAPLLLVNPDSQFVHTSDKLALTPSTIPIGR